MQEFDYEDAFCAGAEGDGGFAVGGCRQEGWEGCCADFVAGVGDAHVGGGGMLTVDGSMRVRLSHAD